MRLLSILSMTFALPALLSITACGGDVAPQPTTLGTAPGTASPVGTPSTHVADSPRETHTTVVVEAPAPTREVIIQAPTPPPHEVTVVVPTPPSIIFTPPTPGSVEIH